MWTTLRANVVDERGNSIQSEADSVTIGFLPGDVDRSGMTNAADILHIIDLLNGLAGGTVDPRRCDIDRDGLCDDGDRERLLDLLYGVETTRAWLNVALPPRP